MRRSLLGTVTSFVLSASVTACSNSAVGTPSPVDPTGDSAPPTSSSGADTPVADVEPCGGTSDIVATTIRPVAPIGGHETVRFTATDASARGFSMKITDKSRVDVQVVGNSVDKACAFAPEAAKLVEPELP